MKNSKIKNLFKKSSWQSKLIIILGIGLLIFTGILEIEKKILEEKQKTLTERIIKKKETIALLTGGLPAKDFLSLSEKLKKAENERILWSQVAKKILKLEKNGLTFSSFSSTKNQQISIQGTAPNTQRIIQLVEELKKEKDKIKDPFLSNYALRQDGNISFQISFTLLSK